MEFNPMSAPAAQATIRRADTLSDAELADLTDLLVAVVADGASIGWVDPPSSAEAAAYWRGTLHPNNHLLIAELPDPAGGRCRVVGTAQLSPATRANSLHRAEVNKLLVHPAHHRRGIGRALLAELERLAAEMGKSMLYLDTREGDGSNHLYRAAGWTEAGKIPAWCTAADGRSLAATIFYYKLLPPLGQP
jgi:GNAT superfamily N-acetyltransferase